MKRYWKIFKSMYHYHLQYFYQYRFSSFVHLISSLLWFALGMAGLSIVLGNVQDIGGWTKEEMYILMLIFYMHVAFIHAIFYSSLKDISAKIRNGTMDFVFVRPVTPRFWLSINKLVLPQFLRLVLTFIIFIWYMKTIAFVPTIINAIYAVVLFFFGILHFYLFYLLIMLVSFWVIHVFNLPWLVDRLTDGAEMPIGSLRKELQITLTYILPMAFVAYLPALALLGRAPLYFLLIAMGIALVFWVLNQIVWQKAIRRYSSASS